MKYLPVLADSVCVDMLKSGMPRESSAMPCFMYPPLDDEEFCRGQKCSFTLLSAPECSKPLSHSTTIGGGTLLTPTEP